MRIGTWNLKLCPASASSRGQAIGSWMDEQAADLWLLTEVHRDWNPRRGQFAVSSPRSCGPDLKRWAGIASTLPFGRLRTPGDESHAGGKGSAWPDWTLEA